MAEFEALGPGGTEAQFQQFLAYLFRQSSIGLATAGVVAGLKVTQTTTASGSVRIDPGMGVAQDTVLNGATPLVNNTLKTLDVLGPNPASGSPRNDIVVFDAATKTVRSITGTPNATPSDPSVPSTAFPLARLRITASATTIPTAQIDDLRVFTGLVDAKKARRSLSRSSSVTGITTSVETALGAGWTSDAEDGGDASGITYSAGVLTCVRAGLYAIRASALFSTVGTGGSRILMVGKNGTSTFVAKARADGGDSVSVLLTRNVSLAANDTLQLVVYQSSGGDGAVVNALETFWQVERVGDA